MVLIHSACAPSSWAETHQSRGPLHPDAWASPAHPRSRSGFCWQPRPPWPSSPAPPVAAAQPAAAALPGARRRGRQAVTDQGSARPSSAPAPAAPARTTGDRPPQPRAQHRARGSHTPGPPSPFSSSPPAPAAAAPSVTARPSLSLAAP